jgi:hypothetical protein
MSVSAGRNMHVASLVLCRRLYELAPDWDDTYCSWFIDNVVPDSQLLGQPRSEPSVGIRGSRLSSIFSEVPAYDVGYLLQKLPDGYGLAKGVGGSWIVFNVRTMQPHNGGKADTPEDAAAGLCITLWGQGTLPRATFR